MATSAWLSATGASRADDGLGDGHVAAGDVSDVVAARPATGPGWSRCPQQPRRRRDRRGTSSETVGDLAAEHVGRHRRRHAAAAREQPLGDDGEAGVGVAVAAQLVSQRPPFRSLPGELDGPSGGLDRLGDAGRSRSWCAGSSSRAGRRAGAPRRPGRASAFCQATASASRHAIALSALPLTVIALQSLACRRAPRRPGDRSPRWVSRNRTSRPGRSTSSAAGVKTCSIGGRVAR